jgi:hypothetical protein
MKNVFVLNIGDYRPDLMRYTLPTIERYAEKIGANLGVIMIRAYPDAPISMEKLQVHGLGAGAEWNILVDADTMIHPDTPDFTKGDPSQVRFAMGTDVRQMFPYHPYFQRCGHFQGIAGNFIVSSNLTHDLWEPWADWKPLLEKLQRKFNIDEYILSLNLAKYGLRFDGLLPAHTLDKLLVHFGNDEKSDEARATDARRARVLFESWGFTNK